MIFNKKNKIMFIFFIINIIAVTESAFAASLDHYLGSNAGRLVNFEYNASSPDIMSGSNVSSRFESRKSWFTMGKFHKYLGYGTLVAAATAGVTGGDNSFHKGAGTAAAVLAVATCITGFSEYSDYFDMSEGLSKHNIHIVLGTLATVGFVATAVSAYSSDDKGHAGIGIGSTVLMVVPIVVLNF